MYQKEPHKFRFIAGCFPAFTSRNLPIGEPISPGGISPEALPVQPGGCTQAKREQWRCHAVPCTRLCAARSETPEDVALPFPEPETEPV